jgi:hypothetical protein
VRARRQQSQLAKNLSGLELDAELGYDKLSFFCQKHFIGKIAFAE